MTTQNASLIQRNEIVFIESNVADYATLIAGLDPSLEVHVLDAASDGLAQMADILAGRGGIDAIHLVSHGSAGALQLGSLTLDESALQSHQSDLAIIGQSLAADGDLLLYGCNVAQGQTGLEFIGKLAQATGADLAASEDLTGNATKGGDWVLENQVGTIEAAQPLMADAAQSYTDVLATFDLTGASGDSSKIVKQTIGSDEIVLTAQDANWIVGNEIDITGDYVDLDGTIAEVSTESKVTITVTGGKTFDFSSIGIVDYSAAGQTLVITSDRGDVSYSVIKSDADQSWAVSVTDADAQGVSRIELTTSDQGNCI